MAQHKSAKTRIRRNARRTEINTSRVSRLRSYVRKVEQAISAGSAAEAMAAFRAATPELHRAINKGILHRNTVQRKLSRLSTRIKALEVSAK